MANKLIHLIYLYLLKIARTKEPVTKFVQNCTLEEWNAIPMSNKLKIIKQNPYTRLFTTGRNRCEETVLSRLRIGHTY